MKKVIAILLVLVVYMGSAFAGEKASDGRFIAYDNGTVLDTKTKLMWAAKDNGSDINWDEIESYFKNYRGGGYTDWRMPRENELAGLYDVAKTYKSDCGSDVHLTDLIRLTCTYVWASEVGSTGAAYFSFKGGQKSRNRSGVGSDIRVLPVRSGR